MIICSECGGIGEVQDLKVRQHGRFVMQWVVCTACHGTGRMPAPPPVIDPEKRSDPFDGPLTGLVRVGWVTQLSLTTSRLEAA